MFWYYFERAIVWVSVSHYGADPIAVCSHFFRQSGISIIFIYSRSIYLLANKVLV